ncbi:hypothetical protein PUN28_011690 [Cardiocondyla obscurior]|uniref:Uncharacterized protein n=1 Tax=Cardiocondyla obscurior TaxID=286306 RepID=A0AAW2FHR1_9HYME
MEKFSFPAGLLPELLPSHDLSHSITTVIHACGYFIYLLKKFQVLIVKKIKKKKEYLFTSCFRDNAIIVYFLITSFSNNALKIAIWQANRLISTTNAQNSNCIQIFYRDRNKSGLLVKKKRKKHILTVTIYTSALQNKVETLSPRNEELFKITKYFSAKFIKKY